MLMMMMMMFRLIQALLRNARHGYYVLKGHSLATAEMTADFHRLQMLLRCCANVAWQDHEHQQPNNSDHDEQHHQETGPSDAAAAASSDVVHSNNEQMNFEQLLHFPDMNYNLSRKSFQQFVTAVLLKLTVVFQ